MRSWREIGFDRSLGNPSIRYGLWLWSLANRFPFIYRLVVGMAARLFFLLGKKHQGWIHRLPGMGEAWSRYRDMRAPTGRSFMMQWRSRK